MKNVNEEIKIVEIRLWKTYYRSLLKTRVVRCSSSSERACPDENRDEVRYYHKRYAIIKDGWNTYLREALEKIFCFEELISCPEQSGSFVISQIFFKT